MPIPQTIDELDINPNNNSPQGNETVGPFANGYIQTLSAFVKQLAIGAGWKPTTAVNNNGQKITRIADGDTSSTSQDAVTGAQLRAFAYKIGEVRMWHGAVEDIPAVWGPGWFLCDGLHGTADLCDKFIVGAGGQYKLDDTGGANTVTLTVENMPVHSHGVIDHGHGHGVHDPSHNHHVNDPGHSHSYDRSSVHMPRSGTDSWIDMGNINARTEHVATGIWLNASHTGISIHNANVDVEISDTGGGVAHENRPPYYALCFVEYRGI
ncbi:phage tail protein [Mycetohabitans rhizoxinica]|uniref:Phage tail protein n=1 Tax=Mycetohabitans rhizoxinica TaxID=412963 RepID=A0ABZ2Q010_9BURK